jgi:hypothetical protein
MANLIERSGLDWLIILTGKPAFQDAPLPFPPMTEVKAKLGSLEGDKLGDALTFCEQQLKREDDRSDKIESKAFTLIGITGIAAAFITGFASLLLDHSKITSGLVLVAAAAVYVAVVLSLVFTIFLAVKVVTIGEYRFSYPRANDILALADSSLEEVKRQRAIALFDSFTQNNRAINRKGTYLGGAQLWFRNSMVLLVALTLLLALFAPFSAIPLTATQPSLLPALPATPSPPIMPILATSAIPMTATPSSSPPPKPFPSVSATH